MAKFQLMAATSDNVLEELEGMWLEVSGDNVLVMGWDENGTLRALHVIKMLPGWLVKKTEVKTG